MCRERRHRPSPERSREAKAREPRRRRQDAVEGGGSYGTSEGYVTDAISEGREAPAKASRAEAPEPWKALARRHYWAVGRCWVIDGDPTGKGGKGKKIHKLSHGACISIGIFPECSVTDKG